MSIHNAKVAALLIEDFDGIIELRSKLTASRERKAAPIDLYKEHT